ncbi:MAG: VOC family protein [Eggerthellaceae bacterium]|jgi:lactoylglutathione lyase
MKAKFIHHCLHCLDKEKSIAFYREALGLEPVREMGPEDGSWTNTYLANDTCPFEVELTWNRGRTEPYDNAGKDVHMAFEVPDYEAAHALHEKMGCILRDNPALGIYFITDPDGQLIEILPAKQ